MLPKIDQPLFDLKVPSTGETVMFRPFLVKEEKLLLIAQESGNDTDMIRAIKQIVNNCIQDEGFKIDRCTTFDLEYMFLKIRAKSVNNIITVSYRDNEDGKVRDFEINLDHIEIEMPKNVEKNVKVGKNVGITMKYPPASIIDQIREFENEVDLMTFFIVNCIDTIYDDEEIHHSYDHTYEELAEFLDSLPVDAFDKIKDFFQTMPNLQYKIEYDNDNGNKRTIELNNIKDFFMWG
jgi:hypothetical protein